MRKSIWLLGTSALALGLGMASPGALAQGQDDGKSTSEVLNIEAENAAFATVNVETDRVGETNTVTKNTAVDGGSARDNTVVDSFSLYNGILHLQENNGSSNSINAASAVVADTVGGAVPIGAGAQTNSTTFNNDTTVGPRSVRTNNIRNSFDGASGQVVVQQNNGDNNEIGAATAVYGASVTVGNVFQTARANATTFAQEGNGDNDAVLDPGTRRANTINPSFNGANGTMVVQQNNGSANAMSVASSIVGSTGSGSILQNADANANVGTKATQYVVDGGSNRSNSILNSFTGAAGEMIVQQNNGDVNAMSIASAVAGVAGDVSGDITQYPDAPPSAVEDNDVRNIDALDDGSRRINTINPSFDGAQGLVSVQQNNGNTNAMAISNAVVGVNGNVGGNIDQLDSEAEDANVANVDVSDRGRAGSRNAARTNRILDGSFADADGQISVQQNNGDANTMGIANAVVGVTGNVAGNVTQNDTDAENNRLDNINALALRDVRSNTISGAFDGVSGVTTVQQNNGSANAMNVANSIVAVTGDIGGNLNQTDLEAAGSTIPSSVFVDARGSDRDNLINPSFTGYSGVVNVQQNNGDANIMQSSSTLAAVTGRVDNIVQEVDADGNRVSGVTARDSFNDAPKLASNRSNLLTGSFGDSAGHASIQQNNGSANIMSTAQAVAAGMSGADNVSQTVNVSGTSEDSELRDDGSTRNNRIVDSFTNAAGTTSTQQNNGDGNVMSIATAHVALRRENGGTNANADNSTQSVSVSGTVEGLSFSDDDNTVAFGPRNNVIQSSYNGASGVHNVQQNNGNGNVIGAGLGVLVDLALGGSPAGEDVQSQQTTAEGTVRNNVADIDGEGGGIERTNALNASFTGFSGVATVQQNDGDNNSMSTAVAVRANRNAGDDIDAVYDAQARTTGTVTGNSMTDGDPANQRNIQRNGIDSSFDGAEGIVAAQQNTGNNNAINSATGVSANVDSFVPTATAPASSAAIGVATVEDNIVEQGPRTDLDNRINASFNGAETVGSVQQNNGHNNAMGASTQVAADDNSQFGPAVSLAALGSTVSGNTTTIVPPGNTYNNTISGSFNSAQGVMTVQQNNGSNNAIGSAISVVANFTSN